MAELTHWFVYSKVTIPHHHGCNENTCEAEWVLLSSVLSTRASEPAREARYKDNTRCLGFEAALTCYMSLYYVQPTYNLTPERVKRVRGLDPFYEQRAHVVAVYAHMISWATGRRVVVLVGIRTVGDQDDTIEILTARAFKIPSYLRVVPGLKDMLAEGSPTPFVFTTTTTQIFMLSGHKGHRQASRCPNSQSPSPVLTQTPADQQTPVLSRDRGTFGPAYW